MKKKKVRKTVIIIAVICILAGAAAGFFFGRSTQAKADKPYVVLSDYEYSGKVVQDFKTADAKYLMQRFGMTAEAAENFIKSPDDWLGYTYYINIVNPGGKAYNFFRVVCPSNGQNDIYMDITSTAAYSVPGGSETQICLTVFALDDGRSDEDIKAQFLNMNVGYRYSTAEDDSDTKAHFHVAPFRESKPQ